MNILRLSTLSLILAVAVITLGYASYSSAAPPCSKNPRPDCVPDDGDGKILQAKFDLTIQTTRPEHITDDGKGEYHDSSKDHVQVSTGSSPGFRFDTNGQNTSKTSRYEKARLVIMTFTGVNLEEFEIDFRFNQTNGLDLGSLEVDASGTVAASLQYFNGDQVVGFNSLKYGIFGFGALNAPNPNHDDDLDCLAEAEKIKVTRNSDTQWTLESTSGKACRFALDANGDRCTTERIESGSCNVKPEVIDFKFEFTIDQQ